MFEINELLKAAKGRLMSGKKNATVRGISIDSRTILPGYAFIAIKGNNFDGHDFIKEAIRKGAGCIISEPRGRRHHAPGATLIEVKDSVKALGNIARFHRKRFTLPVIAITGSNGKTTVKDMVAWVLSQRFKVLKNTGTKNNHIGLPQTLLNLNSSYDLAVLELGTSHFGEIGYLAEICLANIGIITNIGPSHLEYLKNLRGVFREKYSLIKYLNKRGIAILNADDSLLKRKLLTENECPVMFGFGIVNHGDFFATDIRVLKQKIEFLVNRKYKFTLRVLGYYNIYNALAAIAVGRLFGMEYKDIAARLVNFNLPQSRLGFIELKKIRFIDDSYNSNPLSLKQALEALHNFKVEGRKILVMGDMLELGNRSELFHRQAGYQIARICDVFITVGRLSKFAARAARLGGFDSRNIFTCESTLEARDILFKKISPRPDDIVLVKGSRSMKMEEVFKET